LDQDYISIPPFLTEKLFFLLDLNETVQRYASTAIRAQALIRKRNPKSLPIEPLDHQQARLLQARPMIALLQVETPFRLMMQTRILVHMDKAWSSRFNNGHKIMKHTKVMAFPL